MTAKDFVANGSRADEKRGWRYDLIRKDIDVEKTEGMVPGGTGRAAGGLPAVGVQVGERSFPKLKKLPTNPRLHYFQYKIKDLLEVSLWLRT